MPIWSAQAPRVPTALRFDMFDRYTEKARQALFFARYEISETGGRAIEPEHLLLGLLRARSPSTVALVERAGTSFEDLREETLGRIVRGEKVSSSVEVPFDEQTVHVLTNAEDEANRLKHAQIQTVHLFLGLLLVEGSSAATILRGHGLQLDAMRQLAMEVYGNADLPPPFAKRS